MNAKQAFEVLKLPEHCSLDDIKQAYRALSLEYHPDRSKSEESIGQFLKIKQAYKCLVELKRSSGDAKGKSFCILSSDVNSF